MLVLGLGLGELEISASRLESTDSSGESTRDVVVGRRHRRELELVAHGSGSDIALAAPRPTKRPPAARPLSTDAARISAAAAAGRHPKVARAAIPLAAALRDAVLVTASGRSGTE